jgi:broad specificity phosphatase PhoE
VSLVGDLAAVTCVAAWPAGRATSRVGPMFPQQPGAWDMLLVVRHADAGDGHSWTGPDGLRPLSPTGRRQAEGLVVRLEDYPVDRILSSPTLRSQQTVQPLARDRFLAVEPLAALGVDAGPDQLRALCWDRGLGNVVLCTHGEVIGRLFAALVAEGLVVEDPLDWPEGSTWLVQRTDQGRVYGRLLAPLALQRRQLAGPRTRAGRRSPAWEGDRLPASTAPGHHRGQPTGSSST